MKRKKTKPSTFSIDYSRKLAIVLCAVDWERVIEVRICSWIASKCYFKKLLIGTEKLMCFVRIQLLLMLKVKKNPMKRRIAKNERPKKKKKLLERCHSVSIILMLCILDIDWIAGKKAAFWLIVICFFVCWFDCSGCRRRLFHNNVANVNEIKDPNTWQTEFYLISLDEIKIEFLFLVFDNKRRNRIWFFAFFPSPHWITTVEKRTMSTSHRWHCQSKKMYTMCRHK